MVDDTEPKPKKKSPRLSTKEAAGYLKTSVAFLEKDRVYTARIPYIKVGSRVFYEESALDAFIEAGRRRSTAENARRKTTTQVAAA